MITQGVMYITEQKYLLNGSEINTEKGYVVKNHNFICEKTKQKKNKKKKQQQQQQKADEEETLFWRVCNTQGRLMGSNYE